MYQHLDTLQQWKCLTVTMAESSIVFSLDVRCISIHRVPKIIKWIWGAEFRIPLHNILKQQQQRPFNGLWSGTTRVGRYQKKHSPTHTHRIIVLPLSPFSFCNGPWHPLYSTYVLDSPHVQPLSRSSLVFPLVLNPQLHAKFSNKFQFCCMLRCHKPTSMVRNM